MKLEKGTFESMTRDGVATRDGYLFDLHLADEAVKRMGVYKDDRSWQVIDVDSGLSLTCETTRAKAIEQATSERVTEKFAGYVSGPGYAKAVERFAAAKAKKGWKKAPKSPEPEIGTEIGNLEGERVCISGTLSGMTRSEAFTRLKLHGGIPSEKFTKETTMLVVAANSGKSKTDKAKAAIKGGQKVKVMSGTEFVKALMKEPEKREGFSCAEFGSVLRGEGKVLCKKHGIWTNCLEMGSCTLANRKAKEAKEEQVEEKEKAGELAEARKRIAELEKRISEMEKVEEVTEVQEQAAVTSLGGILEQMQEWAKDKPNVSAYRKNEQPSTPVRVTGETKPYKAELTELGFRWSPKGFWYMGERELEKKLA